jgi:uncharacterized protein YndB with AHSA1/START domain
LIARWTSGPGAPGTAACVRPRIEYVKRGIYRQIVAPERLVFTYVNEETDGSLGPETVVTVTFEDFGEKTRLTLHHTGFDSIPSRDGHEGGWNSALARFVEYLANS